MYGIAYDLIMENFTRLKLFLAKEKESMPKKYSMLLAGIVVKESNNSLAAANKGADHAPAGTVHRHRNIPMILAKNSPITVLLKKSSLPKSQSFTVLKSAHTSMLSGLISVCSTRCEARWDSVTSSCRLWD